tara:strand:+ start:610 stop:2718 length:2109 start_codon:yes stop_codon:yes gene_type:complete
MGMDGFVWFTGVVEDRGDPSKLGRVRVRCVGHHTDDKNKIPTADLPWAHVMHPVTDPSMNGMGHTPSFMVEGTWVIGFFMDAEDKQQPVIIGTLPGVPDEKPNPSKGFYDPNGVYPKSDFLDESDTNRLARGETDNTIVPLKKSSRLKNITLADGTEWDEPETTYDAKYPSNHVFESEAGHIVELDDTSGAERLHEYSSSGTFYEIDKDGNRHARVIGDNKEIINGSNFNFTQKDFNLTVAGTLNIKCKNLNIEVEEDYIDEIEGDRISYILGQKTLDITGAVTENYGSTITRSVSGITTNNHDANVLNYIDGDFEVHTSAAVDIFAKTTVNIDTASFDVDAETVATITSATSTINGSTAANLRGATIDISDTSVGSPSVTDPTEPTITEPTEPTILLSTPSAANIGGGLEEEPTDLTTGQKFKSESGAPFAGSNSQDNEFDNSDLDPPTSTSCTRKDLGTVSAQEESNKDAGALGWDSGGGYSYGTYQVASGNGRTDIDGPKGSSMVSFAKFLRNEKNGYRDFYTILGGDNIPKDAAASNNATFVGQGGTPPAGTFQRKWSDLAKDPVNGERFKQAQHDWVQRTHYDRAVSKIKNSTGIDLCDNFHSSGIQDAIWSTAVQHGPGGANTIFKEALRKTGKTIDTVTDEELINAIYDERELKIKEGGLTSSEKTAVLNRYDRERPKALALNTNTEFNVTSIGP